MNPNETIRLLILNDSRNEAERLISMLRNAGRPTRAQHVEAEEILTKLLQEQAWDLMIAHANTKNIPPQTAIKHIKRLSKDVPVIIQTEEEGSQPVVEALKMGAADAVLMDEDQHLLLVIQREIENHVQRQMRRRADRRYKEAERRSQQLLDSSRDAIAYVQDGMYLYANESFAELFGYDDRDDIECMPVIDMIADNDQDKVKAFLKEFALKGDDSEAVALDFRGLKHDGSLTTVNMQVANAMYDEDPCIQFLVRASQQAIDSEELAAQINEIKHQDVTTSLYNRQYLVNKLKEYINSVSGNQSGALLTIEIDKFAEQIQAAVGVASSDLILSDIAAIIKEVCTKDCVPARFADNSFSVLMMNVTADGAQKFSDTLCKKIADHILEVDGRTVQATLSIGVAIVNETTSGADSVIEYSLNALSDVRKDGGNAAKIYEPKVTVSDDGNVTSAVKAALEKENLKLLFQPIISLRGSEEEHYEVLLRMVTDEGEEVSPFSRLDANTDSALIIKMDRWVILNSIKTVAEHNQKGNKTKLILNLSKHSMNDESLVPWLGVAFKAAKLPQECIVFQLSEADVTNHLNNAKAFVEGVKKLGCECSISNFGCALNPFNALKHVPASIIKIDGSFTLDIQNNNESPETLTNLLKELHQEERVTIVPFVENASVLSTLWQAGAHYIQGQYLQGPADSMNYDFSMDS